MKPTPFGPAIKSLNRVTPWYLRIPSFNNVAALRGQNEQINSESYGKSKTFRNFSHTSNSTVAREDHYGTEETVHPLHRPGELPSIALIGGK